MNNSFVFLLIGLVVLMDFVFIHVNSLEYWAFEILVFLAGLAPNSETNTSLIAIW